MKKEAILTMNWIQRLTSRTEKLILLLSGFFLLGLAQEVHAGFDLGADVVSRYIWRGTDFGNSASVQPYVSFSAGPVEVGAWSSWAVTAPGANENDLYVSASFGPE